MNKILNTTNNKKITEARLIKALNNDNVTGKLYKSPNNLKGLEAIKAANRLTSAVGKLNKELAEQGRKMVRKNYSSYFIIGANPIIDRELNRITNATERARVLRNGLNFKR